MEPIFKNTLSYTKEYYKEYYKYMCFKRPGIIIIDIILGINFVISILAIMFPKLMLLNINKAISNISTVSILILCQIYVFINNKNTQYNRDLEKNNGNLIEVEVLITEEDINVSTNYDESINIKLGNIKKVIRTKNYYILETKEKLRIILKRDGFVKGNVKQFEQFLKQNNL